MLDANLGGKLDRLLAFTGRQCFGTSRNGNSLISQHPGSSGSQKGAVHAAGKGYCRTAAARQNGIELTHFFFYR
ncbi:hypothetical protein SDC9_206537 [bioreactor metagenome]|uniref:Uncharacterized protein n=1 Tax=bioreactor metagenome TaxID=1076179 RepID=A0A645J6S0_9ZZZZ